MLNTITRFPGGVNSNNPDGGHGDLRTPFIGIYAQFFDDFLPYNVANYTPTLGGGTIAQAAAGTANENGVAVFTTAAAGGETAMQIGNPIRLAGFASLTKELFFGARLQVDDATLAGLFIGFSAIATAPITTPPTDGIYITKASGSTTPQAIVRVGGSTIHSATMGSMQGGVWYDFAMVFTPGEGVMRAFMTPYGSPPQAYRVAAPPSSLPTAGLSGNISFSGTAAGARTGLVDYIWGAKSR